MCGQQKIPMPAWHEFLSKPVSLELTVCIHLFIFLTYWDCLDSCWPFSVLIVKVYVKKNQKTKKQTQKQTQKPKSPLTRE